MLLDRIIPLEKEQSGKLQLDDSHQRGVQRKPWEGDKTQEQQPLIVKRESANVAEEPAFTWL